MILALLNDYNYNLFRQKCNHFSYNKAKSINSNKYILLLNQIFMKTSANTDIELSSSDTSIKQLDNNYSI